MPSHKEPKQELHQAIREWLEVCDADIESQFEWRRSGFQNELQIAIRFAADMPKRLESLGAPGAKRRFERKLIPRLTESIGQRIAMNPERISQQDQLLKVAIDSLLTFSANEELSRLVKDQTRLAIQYMTSFGDELTKDPSDVKGSRIQQDQVEVALVRIVEQFLKEAPRPLVAVRVFKQIEAVFAAYLQFLQQTPHRMTMPVDVSALEYLCKKQAGDCVCKAEEALAEPIKPFWCSWPTTAPSRT